MQQAMNEIELMQIALTLARDAEKAGEVPVGAVLSAGDGEIIAAEHNRTIGNCDPSAHAEMLAIREAAEKIGNYRLVDTTLCVTVEPCVMCMGAVIHARIGRLIFGTNDAKWGGAGSLYNLADDPRLNHHPEVIPGVLADECRDLMRDFFRKRRKSLQTA